MPRAFLLPVLALILLLAGCGGRSDQAAPVTLRVPIQWAEQSREVTAPSSAVRVEFTIVDLDGPSRSYRFAAQRTGLSAHQGVATSGRTIPPGPYTVEIQFYARYSPNHWGSEVSFGSYSLFVTEAGTFALPDGRPLAGFSTASRVERVAFGNYLHAIPGELSSLEVFAFDSSDFAIMLSPGSFHLEQVSGPAPLERGDEWDVTAPVAGQYVLRATVDGTSSPLTTLDALDVAKRDIALNKIAPSPTSGRILGIQTSTKTLVELDGTSGATIRSRTFDDEPVALASGSTSIFVGFRNRPTVARLNPADLSEVYRFDYLLNPAPVQSDYELRHLAVSPGDPDLVAVGREQNGLEHRFFRNGAPVGEAETENLGRLPVWLDGSRCALLAGSQKMAIASVGTSAVTYDVLADDPGSYGGARAGIAGGGFIVLDSGERFSETNLAYSELVLRASSGGIARLPDGRVLLAYDPGPLDVTLTSFSVADPSALTKRSVRFRSTTSRYEVAAVGTNRFAISSGDRLIIWTP